jgi:protein ImuB
MAETFLTFSPRVHYRTPGWVFVDVGGTARLFGGEGGLLKEVRRLTDEFFPGAAAAVADTPAAAQAVATVRPFHIVPPAQEQEQIKDLPLAALLQLEGLVAWRAVSEIESVIDFFHALGFKKIGDLHRLSLESWRDRWGETGSLLWRRIHGRDRQVISPLLPREALTDYVYFDFSVSLLPFLLHSIERSLERLFARLQGRGEFAAKVLVHLHNEYDRGYHLIEVKPVRGSREIDLYLKLLENKLAEIDLQNPVKEFSIEIISCPEKVTQLDFWETRNRDQERLAGVLSLFSQAQLTTGFLRPKSEVLPEDSWEITAEFQEPDLLEDRVETEGQSFQLKPCYGRGLNDAPRPSRLLSRPKRLSDEKLRRLKFLSHYPIERLDHGWWENSRGRDYYFALSPEGKALWVFHDRIEDCYYLHGYFD